MPSLTFQINDLLLYGPIIEVIIAPPKNLKKLNLQSVVVHAMIDTGASSCVVNPAVIQKMGLNPIDSIKVNTPSSTNVRCYRYQATVCFPSNLGVETEIIEMPLQNQHYQCLIGRDILKRIFTPDD